MFGFGQYSGDNPVAAAINAVILLLVIAIFIRAILSWFSIDPRNPLIEALTAVTEPILEPIRRFMPNLGIDLSPMIAIIVLEVIARAITSQLG
jgi:YggT family protein